MIFLSHNHQDKPVVEPIAIRLREIFGQNKVFYDSWSIQPGDGIIQKMNEGMASPKIVFFFVSQKSLTSKMVELEWQTALFKSTKGECRLIPIRVDGSAMPPLLLQNLYIDMFMHGIEATILQIVNIVQGNNSFTPQHLGFSNLTYEASWGNDGEITIVIRASHLMEPNPDFLILHDNKPEDFRFELDGGNPSKTGHHPGIQLDSGQVINAFYIAPLGGTITPSIPLTVKLTPTTAKPIIFRGVMHKKAADAWSTIPAASSSPR